MGRAGLGRVSPSREFQVLYCGLLCELGEAVNSASITIYIYYFQVSIEASRDRADAVQIRHVREWKTTKKDAK